MVSKSLESFTKLCQKSDENILLLWVSADDPGNVGAKSTHSAGKNWSLPIHTHFWPAHSKSNLLYGAHGYMQKVS